MDGQRLAAAVLVVTFLFAGTCRVAAGSADDVEVELVGFLGKLPEGGLRLPLSSVMTGRFEVPNEQGGARVAFTVEFTPRTEFSRGAGLVRDDQLVVLEGVLKPDRLQVLRVREIEVAEYGGRLSLRGGPLALPLATDQLVEVFLDGAPNLPVTFLLTPRTTSRRTSLRDGQPVTLAVVNGRRLVVGIEASDSR